MPTAASSGTTATLTLGTETTLFDTVLAGSYVLQVDLTPMAAADIVTLRMKAITLSGDAVPGGVAYEETFYDAQTKPIVLSVPVPTELGTTGAVRATILQQVGTAHAFKWKMLAL